MLLRVLKNNPNLLELTKIYFDAMSEFNMGKASAVFHDRARDLGHLVLTNKSDQVKRTIKNKY